MDWSSQNLTRDAYPVISKTPEWKFPGHSLQEDSKFSNLEYVTDTLDSQFLKHDLRIVIGDSGNSRLKVFKPIQLKNPEIIEIFHAKSPY